jgi:hypothetical protein
MSTDVEICNLALQAIGADTINQLVNPQRVNEKRCALIYQKTVRAELSKRRWFFTIETQVVQKLPGMSAELAPRYQFPIPNDCLRVIRGKLDEWETRDGVILHAGEGPIEITFIKRKTEASFPDVFVDVLTYALAMQLAIPCTNNRELRATMQESYRVALTDAAKHNAFTRVEDDIAPEDVNHSFVSARF